MQPLLAMCEVSHVVGNRHLIMLGKSGCWGCLNCCGGWACSQLPFCCVVFVSWSGFMAMKEGTERFRHLLLLAEGRSIVGFHWIVGFLAGDWFNVPRLAVVVRKDRHWSWFEAILREMGLDSCSRAHYFQHRIKNDHSELRIAVPHFILARFKASCFSWTLEKAI